MNRVPVRLNNGRVVMLLSPETIAAMTRDTVKPAPASDARMRARLDYRESDRRNAADVLSWTRYRPNGQKG